MRKIGNVLWGLVFVIIGIIIAFNSMGMTNIDIFFDGWWTLFIIIPSFIGVVKEPNKMWSMIWLVVGVVLLVCAQGVLSFGMISKFIFPFILVCIGLSIIFKDAIGTKASKRIKELSNKEGLTEYTATFSSNKAVLDGPFDGASVDAVFGGVSLDLRRTSVTGDKIINANAIFGGITIHVPQNVNVKVKSTPIFGGVDNKALYNAGDNVPTIFINSFCMFGGVEIR